MFENMKTGSDVEEVHFFAQEAAEAAEGEASGESSEDNSEPEKLRRAGVCPLHRLKHEGIALLACNARIFSPCICWILKVVGAVNDC